MYCSKCGNKINDNATFCGNCGNKIEKKIKPNKIIEMCEGIDFIRILKVIKEYFLRFYVDYNSKFFKIAMSIFLAIGIGEPTYVLVSSLLPINIYGLFSGAATVFKFLICALLFGVFCVLFLKIKNKTTVKKSNFLIILWIVSLVLNFLVFLADMELYQYILFSNYAGKIVEILAVGSTVALILKNKSKYPFILMISALSFALSKSSMWSIKFDIDLYEIYKTNDYLIDVLDSLKYIVLVVVLFLLVYLVPRKISRWIVYVPALSAVILSFIRLVDNFSFIDILDFIIEVSIIEMFVLLALSCSKIAEYDYIIENKGKAQKRALKIGVTSVGSLAIVVLAYLLISAIVCSLQINSGIEKWKSQIVGGRLKNETEWDSMSDDIFKYNCTKFVSQFVDEYSFYETLKNNCYSMEKISVCYSAYQSGTVSDDIVEKYSYININDNWHDDPLLSTYYSKYIEMQPDIDNVSVSGYVDVNNGEIEITVKNANKMPVSKCTVKCDFTILFVEAGYYSDVEYGRGSKTIEIENIEGNAEKTKTISFNPDDYYDSYGSYILASLSDKTVNVISIE
ncbi:MAG: zinc ribbon domain-containing protein [Oscillospiraceae bacterium]|nr:zinc ribbon domain-containing protein [Oscillospiraceae bacterium]